jgi:hypothetical protein
MRQGLMKGNGYRTVVAGILYSVLGVIILGSASCTSLGHKNVSPDRFNYNEAISRSTQEQMLLNLVRLRFFETPVFLAVSSVLTQYSYAGGIGVFGVGVFGDPSSVGGSTALEYSERPTITYMPIEGQAFSKRLLAPIPVDLIFALGQAGWAIDDLMVVGLQQINDVKNMSFGTLPPPGDLERAEQMERDIGRFENFRRFIRIMLRLFDVGLLEVQHRKSDSNGGKESELVPYFVLSRPNTKDETHLIAQFRESLGLDPAITEFQVTERLTGRDPDEITIQTRSLLAIMSFLSRGVQVPEHIRQNGWVIAWEDAAEAWEARFGRPGYKIPFPFLTQVSDSRPPDAFVAVKAHGSWFYIENKDIESKRVFSIISMLFRLLAPAGQGEAPVLTLPTGP